MRELLPDLAPPDVLETPRLVLRPPVNEDAEAIAEIANDWELASRLARLPHPYSVEDARWFLANIVPVEIVWAIERRGDGALMGMVGLSPRAESVAELGYWIGRRFWGCGFMTEAARAAVAYGFDVLGLQLQTAEWFQENPASGHVLEKLGFQQVGFGQRSSGATGEARATVEMRLARPSPQRS